MADVEGIEGARVDAHARTAPLQVIDQKLHIRLAVAELPREAVEEGAAPFAVLLDVQVLELPEDLVLVGKQIDGAAVDDDLAIEVVEFGCQWADCILRACGENGLAHTLSDIGRHGIPALPHQIVERLNRPCFAVIPLRIPDDVVEERGQKQLGGHLLVLPGTFANGLADVQQMVKRVEVAVRLHVGTENGARQPAPQLKVVGVALGEYLQYQLLLALWGIPRMGEGDVCHDSRMSHIEEF